MTWAALRSLLAGLLRRRRFEQDLSDEIDDHLEARTRDLIARGLDRATAERSARLEFGSIEGYKEEVRRARGLRLFDELRADLTCGWRGLRRSPGFTLVASLSLALGIGANTLVFSLLDSTILRPLSLPEPDRLVTIWNVADTTKPDRLGTSSIPRYLALRDATRSFESMAAHNGIACGIKTLGFEENGAPPERVLGQTVSPSMFRTLGVEPMLGRTFTEDEDRVDQVAAVVVLTHRMWQRRYAGDPAVVGKTMMLDRLPTTIIGVMPERFDLFGEHVEFFLPLCLTRAQVESRIGGNTVIARLKPGVTVAQAQAEIDAASARLAVSDPVRHKGIGSYVEPLQRARVRMFDNNGQVAGNYADALMMLQGAVGFVLLIACANVAGLLLARTASRRTEVAVRQALGGGRGRIARQLITETFPLAVLGAVAGVLLARGGLAVFVAVAPPEFPKLAEVAIDGRVLAFTALVVLATTLVFASVPALQAARTRLTGALSAASRSNSSGRERQRARSVLVSAQVALAVVLLVGAGLMLHSFVRVLDNDLGADPTNLLTFDFRFPARESYKQLGMYRGSGLFAVSPVPAETVERVLDRVSAVPGVVSVGAVNLQALSGGTFAMPLRIEGRPEEPSTISAAGVTTLPTVDYFAVTRGFFDALKIPLRAGRDFGRFDTPTSPFVVIVNEAMVRQFFPGQDPIGQRVRFDFLPDERSREIVGVVGDTRAGLFQGRPTPTVYVPHVQQTSQFVGPMVYSRISMNFVIRTIGEPMAMLPAVKGAIAEVDRTTPVGNASTVEQTLDAQVRHLRLYMLLLGLFGAVSVVLAATGVYGVLAHSVAERTREIGIRMALGARLSDVLMMVLRRASWLIGVGLVLGLSGALVLARVIESNLFEVTVSDPMTYAAVAILLLLIAGLASLVPARRAAVVSPTEALKQE